MAETIFSSALVKEAILPFLLVFVLIFAILEKTKILGEGKKQINAIISLVIALILIVFPYPRDIIVNLMPVLAVVAVVLFVFMLLYGFVGMTGKEFTMPKGLKITFGILIAIVLIVAILIITGYWENFSGWFSGESGGKVWQNIIIILIIGGVIALVLSTGGGSKDKG